MIRFISTLTLLLAAAAFSSGQTARLQVIHNAADPGAAMVDVYLDGTLLLDDFAFREATAYIDAPAGVPIDVGIAPPTSTSAGDTIANFDLMLTAGETYVAMANGVLDPGMFDANPDARSTAFTLFVKAGAREAADDGSSIEFFAVHGATDAPTVDVIARSVATLVDNAAYGDITGYLAVPPSVYTLDVTPGDDSLTIVASFTADLSTLAGGSAVVFASGFLNPATNQNGEAFGLFAALANGTVAAFTPKTTDVREESTLPRRYGLDQNYPNPFNPTTKFTYSLPASDFVTIVLHDVAGREVMSLVEGTRTAGTYSVTVDGGGLPSGVYFYSMRAGDYADMRKMTLMK